jgi:hypothetical protein
MFSLVTTDGTRAPRIGSLRVGGGGLWRLRPSGSNLEVEEFRGVEGMVIGFFAGVGVASLAWPKSGAS